MNIARIAISLFGLTLLIPAQTIAGPYADTLGQCLVESTSQRDRVQLVRWMFSAASLHPAVQPISSVSAEQLDESNKAMADLITELLTESCREEAEAAISNEGAVTLQTAFSVLGQVAGRELFASPEVSEGLSGLEGYLDSEKLDALAGSE